MSLATLLVLVALAAAVYLCFQLPSKVLPVIAAVAAGVEALRIVGVLSISAKGVPLALVLGGTLAAAGALMVLRTSGRWPVVAATAVLFVGSIQLLGALGLV